MEEMVAEDSVWEFEAHDLFVKNTSEIWESFCRVHRDENFTDEIFRGCLENLEYLASLVRPMRLEHTPRLPTRVDAEEELWRRCRQGLEVRLTDGRVPADRRADYEDRAAFEMKVILALQSADYMLLFSDVARFCDERGLPRGPGRGSVGGSLVAWLADITQVDPIRHGLLFERFLDVERLPKMRLGL
jgi:DNA polymerase-3 subunit alpha